jgi:hypothetical protein
MSSIRNFQNPNKEQNMDSTTLRIIAGAGAVVVLFIIVWRRKRKASE